MCANPFKSKSSSPPPAAPPAPPAPPAPQPPSAPALNESETAQTNADARSKTARIGRKALRIDLQAPTSPVGLQAPQA